MPSRFVTSGHGAVRDRRNRLANRCLISNVRSCDRALANSNKAIEIDPICEGRFAAPHESASGTERNSAGPSAACLESGVLQIRCWLLARSTQQCQAASLRAPVALQHKEEVQASVDWTAPRPSTTASRSGSPRTRRLRPSNCAPCSIAKDKW